MRRTVLMISLFFLSISCGNVTKENSKESVEIVPSEIKYQIEKYSTKYHLFDQQQKPFCTVSFTMPRITAGLDDDIASFLREELYSTFFSKVNGGVLLQERFKIEAEKLLLDYKDLEQDFSESNESIGASFNWTYEYSADFFDIGERYLTFRVTKFQNTGGAHPNMTTNYYTLDLKKRERLTIAQTFKLENKKEMENQILKRIKKQFDTEEDFEMNIWKENVTLTDNFYWRDSSFVFYYNPYEIGPFSLGPVEVAFTAQELTSFVKRDF